MPSERWKRKWHRRINLTRMCLRLEKRKEGGFTADDILEEFEVAVRDNYERANHAKLSGKCRVPRNPTAVSQSILPLLHNGLSCIDGHRRSRAGHSNLPSTAGLRSRIYFVDDAESLEEYISYCEKILAKGPQVSGLGA